MELEHVYITELRMYNLKNLESFKLTQHGNSNDLDFLINNIKGCDNLNNLWLNIYE